MTREQTYVAHILFRNKVLESDGTAYETFFTKIMDLANPTFQQVKPQGPIGDRKNDGFDKSTGTYYQVYAPEDPKTKEQDAVNKLVNDFNGLYSYWQNICPIHRFCFVFNDKYKGAHPTIHDELAKIHKAYPDIETDVFLAKHLEEICFSLSDEKIELCLGIIPETYCGDVDYDVLRQVVDYLLTVPVDPTKEFIPINPDFDKKIVFNGLSDNMASYLRGHRINGHSIDDFFKYNSAYTKNALRDIFNGLYQEALKTIDDNPDKPDQVFLYIYDHSFQRHTGAVDNAIFTLMAYYFEYCDIFEAPVV